MKRLFKREQGVLALLAMLVLFLSYYLQYVEYLEPCPLCLMQRFMMFGLLFCSLGGVFLFTRRRGFVFIISELFLALGGMVFAFRQLWLQSLPVTDSGMCLPRIEAFMHKLPWQDIVHAFIWGGTTGCGEVDWTLAGFSMPAWSAVYFGLISLISMFFLIRLCKYDCISD